MKVSKETIALVRAAILAQCLLIELDNLKGTQYYSQQFKQATNNYCKLLEKIFGNIHTTMFGNDQEFYESFFREVHTFIERFSATEVGNMERINSLMEGLNSGKYVIVEKQKIPVVPVGSLD